MTSSVTPAGTAAVDVNTLACGGDRRALFGRLVSDIGRQVAEGILRPGDRVASARQMTEHYSVSIVTAQRAQRELQNQRITFGVQGLGTFVHPDALAALQGNAGCPAAGGLPHDTQILGYLAQERALVGRYVTAGTAGGRGKALRALLAHIRRNGPAINRVLGHDTPGETEPDQERQHQPPLPEI